MIGARQLRLEDPGLLTGADRFTADLDVPGALTAVFVRSVMAHARIGSVDTTEAAGSPGVVAVFTADDLDLPSVGVAAFTAMVPDAFRRFPLARSVVRFVGEVVAVVVAETEAQARDAADLVEVDYEPLPALVDPVAAAADGAEPLFPDAASNVALHLTYEAGEPCPDATVRVRTLVEHPRMAVAPMEPNAIVAEPGPEGRLTMWVSSQWPHRMRDTTAELLGMAPADLRVVCPAVGGGFGGKTPAEPDYVVVAAIARRLGRPVRWVQTRSENLLTMQARGHRFDVTLAATPEGRVRSIEVDLLTDLGAYPGVGIGMTLTARSLATGCYDIPHARFDIRGVATNTPPTGAFRGAGRPEAMHMLERAMDVLAAELGIDPVELRRRNFVPRARFPYRNVMGESYDSADFGLTLAEALRLVDYEGLRAEQRRRAGSGSALGVGVCCYVEVSAGNVGLERDDASVEVTEDGQVVVVVGTSAHGQGHVTTYAQIVATTMGVDVGDVRVVQSDTAAVPKGQGTGGSRSIQIGGSAIRRACDQVVEQAAELAAHLLEVSVEDVEVVDGGLGVRGVPGSTVSWAKLAATIGDATARPPGSASRLFADEHFDQGGGTSPFGCHVAVVEVDTETGRVRLVRIVAVDDCGVVINPMLAEGQVHGGLAAGIGQALFEHSVFDDDGNPLTATFADYGMPSAADLPSYETAHTVTPTELNPLGAKGLGEAGTTGSIAAVHNAVLDALAPLGVRNLDIPLTPMRVWRAIHDADGR